MMKAQLEEKRAVDAGYWPLYHYNPTLEEGKRFTWETKEPTLSYQDFIRSERRYTAFKTTNPENAEALFAAAEEDAKKRMAFYKKFRPFRITSLLFPIS